MVLLTMDWVVVLNDHYSVRLNPLLEMASLGAVGLVARVRLPSQPMTEREQRGGQLDRSFSLPL